ncbi:hypothetical protein DL93DRAFT_2232598 [Clavulina sp. PMI_390]|nr:hypothetical protein DL93DRAFT_2232598 [Clavulina sp. PMI_390]
MSLERGVYRIHHSQSPIVIDLHDGLDADATQIRAWENLNSNNQAWLIDPIDEEPDTFFVQNIMSGTYMDLTDGSADDFTSINGCQRSGEMQKWLIKSVDGGNFYKIQNKMSKRVFVSLFYLGNDQSAHHSIVFKSGQANETKISGAQGDWDSGTNHDQEWKLQCLTLSAEAVRALLKSHPLIPEDFPTYITDGIYMCLPREIITNDIWKKSDLSTPESAWRSVIFDCDDFAFCFKADVSRWGRNTIKVDAFGILAGIMFGVSTEDRGHAFNWTILEEDLGKIVFFEPQDGTFEASNTENGMHKP